MTFILPPLLPPALIQRLQAAFAEGAFVDGNQTAGTNNQNRKRNEEISAASELRRALADEVRTALTASNDFRLIAQPKRIGDVLLSRYRDGMFYGDHADNTIMGTKRNDPWRADLSFTIFLSDPQSYDGGELVLNTDVRPEPVKLAVGQMVVYSTLVLHRVNPVTRGERHAAVGWVQSMVRDPHQRQTLLDVAQAISYFHRHTPEKTEHPEAVRLEKVYANLLRMWADL